MKCDSCYQVIENSGVYRAYCSCSSLKDAHARVMAPNQVPSSVTITLVAKAILLPVIGIPLAMIALATIVLYKYPAVWLTIAIVVIAFALMAMLL
jgi:hypothetical protein